MKSPLLAISLLALGLAGCNANDARELREDAGNLAETAVESAGDAQLVARIWAALANRKGVDLSGLHIESEDGVITLSGHVPNAEERARVRASANDVRGVKKVIDKLRIDSK
jgi:hyperosmotically inducible protein